MYYPSFREIKSTIAGSRDIFYNQLLPNLYNSFSTLLLGYWWGNASAGILEAAKRVINLSDQALSVLSRTFFPFLAKNLSKHNLFLKLSLAASIGFALIYIFGANVIVKLLYSKEFYEARLIIILMSISPILFALMNAYGTNYLILINKEKLLRNITVISSLIGFVLALVLIYYFKTYGAALTIIISRSLIGGLSFYFSRKLILSTQKL
jgi:PST family polysaccharide transporter